MTPVATRIYPGEWVAVDADTDDGTQASPSPCGVGATEAEAIADLLRKIEDISPMSDQPTYHFKWSNVDLKIFVKGRHDAANLLRRQAEILTKRADQIDAETDEWETSLQLVKDET